MKMVSLFKCNPSQTLKRQRVRPAVFSPSVYLVVCILDDQQVKITYRLSDSIIEKN